MTEHDTFAKYSTQWLNFTPMFVKRFLCRVALVQWSVPKCVLNASGEVFRTNPMRNIAFITHDELQKVSLLCNRAYLASSSSWRLIPGGHPAPHCNA